MCFSSKKFLAFSSSELHDLFIKRTSKHKNDTLLYFFSIQMFLSSRIKSDKYFVRKSECDYTCLLVHAHEFARVLEKEREKARSIIGIHCCSIHPDFFFRYSKMFGGVFLCVRAQVCADKIYDLSKNTPTVEREKL